MQYGTEQALDVILWYADLPRFHEIYNSDVYLAPLKNRHALAFRRTVGPMRSFLGLEVILWGIQLNAPCYEIQVSLPLWGNSPTSPATILLQVLWPPCRNKYSATLDQTSIEVLGGRSEIKQGNGVKCRSLPAYTQVNLVRFLSIVSQEYI